jgi:hypothetical protein
VENLTCAAARGIICTTQCHNKEAHFLSVCVVGRLEAAGSRPLFRNGIMAKLSQKVNFEGIIPKFD